MYDANFREAVIGQYSIVSTDSLIQVVLDGEWNLSTEIRYLTELSTAIENIRHNPWGMVVDMRSWKIPAFKEEDVDENLAKVHLSRSNQRCECWIVRDEMQALQLQSFVDSVPGMAFRRVVSVDEADAFLTSKGFVINKLSDYWANNI